MMSAVAVLLSVLVQEPSSGDPLAYGNVLLRVPQGWKAEPQREGLFLRPSDLKDGEAYVVIIPPGTKADVNLPAGFERTWTQAAGTRKIAKKAPERELKTEGGTDGLMSVGLLDGANGERVIAAVALFKPGDRFQAVLALTAEDPLFQRYSEPLRQLMKDLRFRNVELPAYDLLMSLGFTEKEGKTTLYVLFRDGTWLPSMPPDGLDQLDGPKAKRRFEAAAGTHETKEGVLTLRAGPRTEALRATADGSYRSPELGAFQRVPTSTGFTLDGRYVRHGGTHALAFKADGTVEEEGKRGTYEIYNNTLYVSLEGAAVRKVPFVAMPGARPEFVYLGSAWYRRE